MVKYTNPELTDMVLIYGEALSNADATSRLYVLLHLKKMQVLSMFRSPCAQRFPPKIIIIRIERAETIKDRREHGEGLFVFGLWSETSDRCGTVKGAETASG
jgi:hypothetical protein